MAPRGGAAAARGAWLGIPRPDLDLMRRLTLVIATGVAVFAGLVHVNDVYSHKFFEITGRAQWIWASVDVTRGAPVAFFAVRDFELPEDRYFARLKMVADPEYTLYFNGTEIARRSAGQARSLDLYDLTSLARTGRNRIVVAVRASRGVGGVIASLDLAPERRNVVVTDEHWKILTTWHPEILQRDRGAVRPPMVIGDPPIGRWNYLAATERPPGVPPSSARLPLGSFLYEATIPVRKEVQGIPIVTSKRLPARAFDFGDLDARLRVTRRRSPAFGQLVEVRFANIREELLTIQPPSRSYVFAPGETSVTDPDLRRFRYVAVLGDAATVEALVPGRGELGIEKLRTGKN